MPQKAGRYVLRAVDEAGRADGREVNVEYVPWNCIEMQWRISDNEV